MKCNFKVIPLLLFPLVLASCGQNGDYAFNKSKADEVAECDAIAQISRGRDGSHVMYQGEMGVNMVYKPWMPPHGETGKPIYKTSLILSTWFEQPEKSIEKCTLKWTFEPSTYTQFHAPTNPNLPHATVSFYENKFPPYGEKIYIKMTAEITYKNATSQAIYNIYLVNTVG